MIREIQTYDPGGSNRNTTETTTNKTTINKILKQDIRTNVNHITDNIVGIPNQLANRLFSLLEKSVPKAISHRQMQKNGTIKGPGLERDVPDRLFDTGAGHSSYISKSWVDEHREELDAHINPIKVAKTLRANKITVSINELLTLQLSFYLDTNSDSVQSEMTMDIHICSLLFTKSRHITAVQVLTHWRAMPDASDHAPVHMLLTNQL